MKRSRATGLLSAGLALSPFAARAQGNAPYKLGVTWPLTGPFAGVGAEFLKGGQIATEDINAAGGIKGRKLQLLIEDSAGTPQGGVAAYRKLVQVDGVQAIWTIFTNVVTAQIPLSDELKIPTMGSLEAPGLFTRSEYSFSHAPTWDKDLPLMVTYWKSHNIKRVYGLLTNSAMGALQSPAVKAAVTQMGGEYNESLLDPNVTDFRGVLERVRAANPQVVLMTGQGSSIEATALKQGRELGIGADFWNLGNSLASKTFRDTIGPFSERMVVGGLSLDPSNPATNAYARKFRAALGYLPTYPSAECYDVVKIFAWAIDKAGYNGPAIRDAIATMKGVPSVLGGTITMGSDHYSVFTNIGLWQVKSGKLVKIG
jgi:branched-chain amino acid transport system substrate-binding protein